MNVCHPHKDLAHIYILQGGPQATKLLCALGQFVFMAQYRVYSYVAGPSISSGLNVGAFINPPWFSSGAWRFKRQAQKKALPQ